MSEINGLIQVFRGKTRGLGEEPVLDGGWLKMGFGFREILHLFPGARLHVFQAIILHSDEEGRSYPSYDLLQKETGYGRETVARALEALCTMAIQGNRVLLRYREHDDQGHFTGSNRYLIFPTPEEIKRFEEPKFDNRTLEENNQSSILLTLDKSTVGISGLKEEPEFKEEPSSKKRGTNAKKEGAKSDPLLSDPRVSVVRGVLHLTPNNVQRNQIIAQVPADKQELWEKTLEHWAYHGWSPKNIPGVLDFFLKGGASGCGLCAQKSRNGKGQPPTRRPGISRTPDFSGADELEEWKRLNPGKPLPGTR